MEAGSGLRSQRPELPHGLFEEQGFADQPHGGVFTASGCHPKKRNSL